MKHNLEINKKVKKFLAKHQDIAVIFYQKIYILHKNIYTKEIDIKPLTWKKNHYRMRIGKYRFAYEIIKNKILIYFYDSDTRGDIYKK